MKLIPVSAAATRLSVSRGHVYNLVAAGLLARYDVAATGGKTKLRISEDDLDRYIAEAARPVRKAAS